MRHHTINPEDPVHPHGVKLEKPAGEHKGTGKHQHADHAAIYKHGFSSSKVGEPARESGSSQPSGYGNAITK